MAKTIKIPSIRLYELSTTIDDISPKELVTLKEIRMTSSLVNEMQAACKTYTDLIGSLQAKQMTLLKDYQTKANEEMKEFSEKEREEYVKEMNAKYQAEVNKKYKKELDEIQKEADKECSLELSDEKMAKLKELFTKYSVPKYTNKQVLLIVADALGIEE